MGTARSLALSLAAFVGLTACDDEDTSSSKTSVGPLLDAGIAVNETALSCPDLDVACTSDPKPRFEQDVMPILQRSCADMAGCHTGKGQDPWALDDYSDNVDWSASIRSDLRDCTMPPADAGVAFTLQERTLLSQWLQCGMLK